MDIMLQSACLVINPIMVSSSVSQVSDSMATWTLDFYRWVGVWCLSFAGNRDFLQLCFALFFVSEKYALFNCFSVMVHCIG